MRIRRLAYPYILWMVLFTIVPLLLIAYYAFTTYSADGRVVFTLKGFVGAMSGDRVELGAFGLRSLFGLHVFVPIYINTFLLSLEMALACTLICLAAGYPVSVVLASRARLRRGRSDFLLFLFVMPMWMNALLRTYAWLALLEPKGIVNTLLGLIGIAQQPFLYNKFAIGLGMVYNYLPYMVLPIYSVLVKIDPSVVEAAEDLGANRVATFLRIIFPLSTPGILSGVNMVFMPAMTTFLIPNLLGGGRYLLIGNVIERQYMVARDWTTASALSIVLLVFVLLGMRVLTRYEAESEGGSILL
jgi:spermidine/putrescine transport system permease protein